MTKVGQDRDPKELAPEHPVASRGPSIENRIGHSSGPGCASDERY